VRREQVNPSSTVRPRRSRGPSVKVRKPGNVPSEIDLHGKTVEEAIEIVDRYLDDAMLAGLHSVRLIHGYGTLRLRDAIQQWLSGRPGIQGFGPADPISGGIGVTVVRLGD